MKKILLHPKDVLWKSEIGLDKNFCTFFYDNSYYRATKLDAQEWLEKKDLNYLLDEMAKSDFIPQTEEVDLSIKGFGKIYKQYTEYFSPIPIHISCEALKESAILWLNFNKWLLEKGLGLIDGHCANIIFQGPMNAKWCDIGSIIELFPKIEFIGLEEFLRYYIYPMLLRKKNPWNDQLFRMSLYKGIRHESAASLVDFTMRQFETRAEALSYFLDYVENIEFNTKDTLWSDYYNDPSEEIISRPYKKGDIINRISMFTNIFNAINPKTVIDLGANAGIFSRYMATQGAEVLALEPDETAVIKHHKILRSNNFSHKIKLMVSSIGEYVKPAEMVTALALTHHLFFTELYPWKYIVKLLSSYTTNILLTEFMPNGMGSEKKPNSLPENYRIEVFVGHLERYFSDVKILDYPIAKDSAPRIFILCKNKREQPIDDGMGALPWDEPYMQKVNEN